MLLLLKNIDLDTDLINQLETMAKEKKTDINTLIKIILVENEEFKNPSFLTTTKVSQSKKTVSTVIPSPIKNKFNIEKGQTLFWDIEDNKIIIVPEPEGEDLPETNSIKAGIDILTDVLENKSQAYYSGAYGFLLRVLNSNDTEEDKITQILEDYKTLDSTKDPQKYKDGYNKVIIYLLDKPLEPSQIEILRKVYEQINK